MTDERPRISVIVPTYGRPKRLRRCLVAFARQHMPRGEFEVIVVDDGSPEPVETHVRRFQDRLNISYVRQTNAGPATARNRGAKQARGALLVFTDDDCAPTKDWLRRLIDAANAAPEAMLGGSTVNALPRNPCSQTSELLVTFMREHDTASDGQATFFASNNIAVPADGFAALGGFDVGFPLAAGEDRDFCDRWRASGRLMQHVPMAVVRHAHRLTLRGFWRQHYRYGRGAAMLRAFCPTARRGLPKPTSFYFRLVVFPLTRDRSPRGVLHVCLMCLAQVANAMGVVRQKLVKHVDKPRGGAVKGTAGVHE